MGTLNLYTEPPHTGLNVQQKIFGTGLPIGNRTSLTDAPPERETVRDHTLVRPSP